MAALLLTVHVGVWRPVRNLLVQRVAYPVVASVETERSARFDLRVGASGRTIEALPVAAAARGESFHAPAGLEYLVAALVLIAAFPRRLYWFYLWLAHLALGVVAFAGFVVGVGWAEVGLAVAFFVRVYAVPAVSLLGMMGAFSPTLRRGVERER